MLGAEVHLVNDREERMRTMPRIAGKLRDEGVRVFEIPLGGATAHGALGFVEAAGEVAAQLQVMGLRIDRIFQASSTGGTHAGLMVGARLFGLEHTRIIGVSPDDLAQVITADVRRLLTEVGELLGISTDGLRDEVMVLDQYAGPGYCVSTPESEAAMALLARTEGIFLDSVYTAKAMAALLDWIRQGRLTENDNVLFWHTGGQVTLFYTPVTDKQNPG
ncbi:MAG: 1-aminocyclopropane-1-carboxylate deaminase/D-cysteine desulfhydrase [Blastocatellia bacterium]